MSILSVSNLRKVYGDTLAVDDLSFSTEPGEIVGLLGPNGAGKTTTINMILGVLEPTSGRIQVERFNLATERREALLRTNFAAVYAPLPGNLTVEQNLRFFGMAEGTITTGCWIERAVVRSRRRVWSIQRADERSMSRRPNRGCSSTLATSWMGPSRAKATVSTSIDPASASKRSIIRTRRTIRRFPRPFFNPGRRIHQEPSLPSVS